jgi:hypothetical protein
VKEFITQGTVKELLDEGNLNVDEVAQLINKAMTKQVLKQNAVTTEELEEMIEENTMKSLIDDGRLSMSEVKQVINQCTVKHMMQQEKIHFDEVKQLLNLDLHEDVDVHDVINQGDLKMEDVKKVIRAGTVNELLDTGLVKHLINQQSLSKHQVKELVQRGALQNVTEVGVDQNEDLKNLMKDGNMDITEAKDILYKNTIKQLMNEGSITFNDIKRLITHGNAGLEELQLLLGQSSLNDEQKTDIQKRLKHKFGMGLDELMKAKFKQARRTGRKGKSLFSVCINYSRSCIIRYKANT